VHFVIELEIVHVDKVPFIHVFVVCKLWVPLRHNREAGENPARSRHCK
jgi:hypothetical protein